MNIEQFIKETYNHDNLRLFDYQNGVCNIEIQRVLGFYIKYRDTGVSLVEELYVVISDEGSVDRKRVASIDYMHDDISDHFIETLNKQIKTFQILLI